MFCKIWAFIKRDFSIQLSYKLHFILTWFNIFGSILIFYFIAKLFEKGTSPYLTEYGGRYFPFVFIGVALSSCLAMTLGTLSGNIRTEQMTGTLEAILVTPIKLYTLVISMSIWNFLFASVSIIIYLLFGVYFFGVKLINVNFLNTIVIFILTIISFSSIGILSSSFIIVFKRGDPVNWLISIFSSFFGGAYFPVEVLPKYLKNLSQILPITYSLRSLRHTLLQGYSFKELLPDIAFLSFFSIILFPLSLLTFKYAVRRAKIGGTLAHY